MKSPGKIIRIQGIAVFVVLTGLIAGFFILFLDAILKDAIEDQGSRVAKAQIDIASLTTSLLSQSVDISDFQIANADRLDENILVAGRIKFDFDGNLAFSKKVIIDDMRLEGLRFNQKRNVPAKPYRAPGAELEPEPQPESGLTGMGTLEGLNFKNPKEILKEEKLETLEAAAKTRKEIEALQAQWQTRIEQQLSPDSLAQLQERLKAVQAKSKNLKDPAANMSITAEIQALRKDIQTRIDTIQNFKKDLEADIRKARTLATQIKNLPKKDFDRLKKKYSLDLKGGTGLVAQMVSGPLRAKIDKAWEYYRKISPYLKSDSDSDPEPGKIERGKGQTIQFRTLQSVPNFLVRHAKFSINVWDQDVEGNFQGLTDDPRLYGKPFQLNLAGHQNDTFKQFKLKLVLDRTGAQAGDVLETRVDGFKIKPVPLGNWATLTKGQADISGRIEIQNEQNMKGDFKVEVHGATFSQAGKSDNEMARMLGQVLKSVNRFYLRGTLSGTPEQYTLSLSTDLDKILAQSVRKLFEDKVKTFERQLKQSIAASTSLPLSEVGGSVAGLMDFRKLLKNNEDLSKNLLSQATGKTLLKKIPGGDSLLKQFKLPF